MRRLFATLLLVILVSLVAQGQSTTPQSSKPSASPGDSSSQQAQPSSTPQSSSTPPGSTDSNSKQTQPSSTPAPPQAASPNQDTQADSSSNHKQSVVKRKLKELAPGCVNVGTYQKCRSSKGKDSDAKAGAASFPDKEYADDMDVGDFYFQKKNYAGAVLRFKDALERKPNDPPATFRLAQSLEALHQADEARDDYSAYLKLEPEGQFAGEAKKALDRLQATSADRAK